MNWITKPLGFKKGEASDPAYETVINGVPYDSRDPSQTPSTPDDYAADEIKRRQVSLALRYVMLVRAR